MKKYVLCFGMIIVAGTPAFAADMPQPFPTRDVIVHYRDTGTNPANFVMHFSPSLQKLRMDIQDGGNDYSILDMATKHNYMVMEADKAYIDISAKGVSPHMLLPAGGSMTRTGASETIAGLKCSVWTIQQSGGGDGTVCVTDDGVLLRSHYNDGTNDTSEATAVDYVPQPASIFEIPAGYEKMEMPVMPGSLGAK